MHCSSSTEYSLHCIALRKIKMCKIYVCENCRMYNIRNDMQKLSQMKLDYKLFWKLVIYTCSTTLYATSFCDSLIIRVLIIQHWRYIKEPSQAGCHAEICKCRDREYWMIYRRPDFLAVVWFVSFPPPSVSKLFLFHSLLCVVGRAYWCDRWGRGGGGGARSFDGEKAWSSMNHSVLSVWM